MDDSSFDLQLLTHGFGNGDLISRVDFDYHIVILTPLHQFHSRAVGGSLLLFKQNIEFDSNLQQVQLNLYEAF